MITYLTDSGEFWLGVTEVAEENVWRWMYYNRDPGPPFTGDWGLYDPNEEHRDANCARATTMSGYQMRLGDADCFSSKGYICKAYIDGEIDLND